MPRFSTLLLLSTITLGAAACNQMKQVPPTGSITQHLMMVDSDGKNYGVVELDPVNGGKIYDAQGRLIGKVVSPGPAPLAPTAQ